MRACVSAVGCMPLLDCAMSRKRNAQILNTPDILTTEDSALSDDFNCSLTQTTQGSSAECNCSLVGASAYQRIVSLPSILFRKSKNPAPCLYSYALHEPPRPPGRTKSYGTGRSLKSSLSVR